MCYRYSAVATTCLNEKKLVRTAAPYCSVQSIDEAQRKRRKSGLAPGRGYGIQRRIEEREHAAK